MMDATIHTNGHNGVHHEADEQIDSLYAWFPPQTPAPAQSCPEAAFSLTLKGTLDGVEALFTVRGQTAAEFKANLQAVRGLLDKPKAPAPAVTSPAGPTQGQSWCPLHNVQMKENVKEGRRWFSHQVNGQWCKGK